MLFTVFLITSSRRDVTLSHKENPWRRRALNLILPSSDIDLHQAEGSWRTWGVLFVFRLTALRALADREQVLTEDPLKSQRNKGGPQMDLNMSWK